MCTILIGDIKYEYIKNKYLSKVSLSDNEIVTYKYDSFGNRTYKIYNKNNSEVVHKYLLDEDKILRETINEKTIDYIYLDKKLIGFIYNENIYYYLKNVFGDITTILDNNGNVVGKYNYDSYGRCYIEIDQSGIATVNPFRYRSYYYDNETNLYYCKNRYYSPMLCRWISSDSIEYLDPESVNGLNLYAYCGNDPINYFDYAGNTPVAVSEVYNAVDLSLKLYKSILKRSIKGLEPKKISLDVVKKIARKTGHKQSARAIQKAIYNSTDDVIKSTNKIISNLDDVIKIGSAIFYGVYVIWTGIENYNNGDEDWLADTVLYAAVNGLLLLVPGGFWISLALNVGLSLTEYVFEDKIEDFKDDFADGWHKFWSFSWN